MFRILVANSKGGSGKTTLTTSLAAHFATTGRRTALVDCDPQGSSLAWCGLRAAHLPKVLAIPGDDPVHGLRAGWMMRVPGSTDVVLIDTPAGLRAHEFGQFARHADVLLIPVVPSSIDLRATLQFIDVVRRLGEVRSGSLRVALVANRVRERTTAARELAATLQRLTEAAVIRVRDSQLYVGLSGVGQSLFDDRSASARQHRPDWQALLDWLQLRAEERVPRGRVTPLLPPQRQGGTNAS